MWFSPVARTVILLIDTPSRRLIAYTTFSASPRGPIVQCGTVDARTQNGEGPVDGGDVGDVTVALRHHPVVGGCDAVQYAREVDVDVDTAVPCPARLVEPPS